VIYVDSSALLKRYVVEPERERAESLLAADPDWVTGRLTRVELRRNLHRLFDGPARATAQAAFDRDWARMAVVELDATTCESAAAIAEATGARSLDALHQACAVRVGGPGLTFLTFDTRQAAAARAVGLRVLGA
jgi:predicted nucleic acid-binding protein